MEKTTKEIKEKKYMEVDIYDTDGDGFIDVCTMALSLIDSETGDTLDVTTIKKQLEKLETLIKSSDTTSEASEKLIKDLKTLQDKVENAERTLDNKIVSNKMEQVKQIEQVKNLIINIQNIINMKADKVHMHSEYANKTHTHSYNDLINKPSIPIKTSELNNDSGFVTQTEINKLNNKLTLFNATCTYDTNYKLTIENNSTLPNYFTLRFKTPNNYIEGKTFNIDSDVYIPKNASFETDDMVSVEFDKVNKKCFFKVGGGSGVNETLPPQIGNFNVISGNTKLDLTWTISDTTYLNGYIFTVKENSVPNNVNDGVKYEVDKSKTSYEINGLNNGTKYYVRPFPYNSKKQYQSEYVVRNGTPTNGMPINSLPIGSKIKFGKYQVETEAAQPIIFIKADNNHYKDSNNSSIADHVTLIAEKIIDLRGFDAKEPNNSDSDRLVEGNNNYKLSNIRQWLNSKELNWFSKTHSTDEPPTDSGTHDYNTGYDTKAGFLNLFSQYEINNIVPTNLKVALNAVTDGGSSEIVSDKVFLLSETEVGLGNENGIVEGKQFSIFSDNSNRCVGVTEQCFNNSKSTSKPGGSRNNWRWWLRAPYFPNSIHVRCVSSGGSLNYYNAHYGYIGVRPALNLNAEVQVSLTPDVDGCYVVL